MHYNGPVIRPHTDAQSLIIEVTTGCTHNACTFCNYYKGVQFTIAPLKQIEEDLKEAKRKWPSCREIWAAGGNPFVLSTEKQIERWKLIKKYFPKARISTYARVTDFRKKTAEDVKRIRESGLDDLMLGIESADDEVLAFVNKGYNAEEILEAGRKMDYAGLDYRLIYLGGIAGKGKLEESARRSAEVFNKMHSYHMNTTTVSVFKGTKLYDQMIKGEWEEPTELERIKEVRTLMAELTVPMTIDAMTAANNLHFRANLSNEKEELVRRLDEVIAGFTEEDEKMLSRRRHSMLSV